MFLAIISISSSTTEALLKQFASKRHASFQCVASRAIRSVAESPLEAEATGIAIGR
jgi:hypothetical protein